MKLSKRQLKRIIREEKQKLLKEEQGFIEQAELEDAVYATFCEWIVEGPPSSKWSDFEAAVARRYEIMFGEKTSVKDIVDACIDSM